jgi:hypothetical protein
MMLRCPILQSKWLGEGEKLTHHTLKIHNPQFMTRNWFQLVFQDRNTLPSRVDLELGKS